MPSLKEVPNPTIDCPEHRAYCSDYKAGTTAKCRYRNNCLKLTSYLEATEKTKG
jgi:hypothetical protein